ncbi:hypothetical protein IJF81_05965, partial [bacterium]|nr:hypothetical protein [bacterium]
MKNSLNIIPDLLDKCQELDNNPLEIIENYREDVMDFVDLIERTINDDPPINLKEGGILKSGVSSELDYYRDLLTGGENWLVQFE